MSTPNFIQTQKDFCAYLRNPLSFQVPQNIGENISVYREISLYSAESLLKPTFPVFRSILSEEQWATLMVQFFEKHYVQSPLSSEVSREFVEFLEKLPSLQPAFLAELAHYEWVELAVMIDISKVEKSAGFNLEQLTLNPTLKLLSYNYPVQQLSVDFQPTQPLDIPIFLAVYRDRNDNVQFMELNAVTAKLVELLGESSNANHIFNNLINMLPNVNANTFVENGKTILKELFDNDVLL
ncbi:MAG: hypothetical protein RIT27_2281 [Pseudomonadota bacterium]|jgi:hypothetical protein